MADEPIVRTHEVDTTADVAPAPVADHPFGVDDHPMHSWDDDTKAGVIGYLEALRDDVHGPRVEAARAALVDIEERLARGDAVGDLERRHANAEYQAATHEHDDVVGRHRTLHVRTPDSFDQVIDTPRRSIYPVRPHEPGGWQHTEAKRAVLIAEHNRTAAELAAQITPQPVTVDTGEHGGTADAAPLAPEVTQP